DVKVAIRAKGKMVGRNAGLQRCEHKGTVVAINLEDGSAAVADKKITGRVEGNSGGNAQPLRHQIRLAVGSEAKDGARVAAGAEESALTIKRQAAGVGDGAAPGFDGEVGIHLEQAYGRFLAAATAQGHKDIALSVQNRVAHRVQVVGDQDPDTDLLGREGLFSAGIPYFD